MKWLKRLFASRWRKKVNLQLGEMRHQVELSSLQLSRLSHKIEALIEAIDCLIPDEKKENRTGEVCMRGDIPMDEMWYEIICFLLKKT